MSFVVLIIGNSKSVHLGAQSTFNGPFLFSIRSPQRRAAGRAAHRYSHDSHHTRWAVFSGKGGWGPGAEGVPAIPAGGGGKRGGGAGGEGVPAGRGGGGGGGGVFGATGMTPGGGGAGGGGGGRLVQRGYLQYRGGWLFSARSFCFSLFLVG